MRAKKGLITDGLFSRCRNPNYLGEMMIYGAFAGHIITFLLHSVFKRFCFFRILLEPPHVVVPLDLIGNSVDLLELPLLAGQG